MCSILQRLAAQCSMSAKSLPHNIVTASHRIERVVMLSLVNLILTQLHRLLSMQWIAVFFLATNLVCVLIMQSRDGNVVSSRVVICIRRVSLYIFTHALIRATAPVGDSWSQVMIQGVAVLAALCLVPERFSEEEEGDQFASQVVYAYATNVEGLIQASMYSRVFNVVAISLIVGSAFVRSTKHNLLSDKGSVLYYVLQAFDLIVFDSFTTNAFRESGDHFCDLSIVFFIFILLWNVQERMSVLSGIQQFTTWRISQFIADILRRQGVQNESLLLMSAVLVLLMSLQRLPHLRWAQDLGILVAIQACVAMVTAFLDSMGDFDGLPVLLSVTVIVTFVNDLVTDGE
jgi:hypothetical protein